MSWATSDRRQRLPANWPTIRAEVQRLAGNRCEAEEHARGCNGYGTDADHIISGDNHDVDNLQWLSAECHKAKTARESAQRNHLRATMRRRTEQHPFFA